jgi:hypothetical protein
MKKNIPSYTFLCTIIVVITLLYSCKKENNPDVIPPAKMTVSVSGDYSDQLTIDLPGNYLDTSQSGQTLNGGYSSPTDQLIIAATFDSGFGGITLISNTGGINTGTFSFVNDQTSYNNFSIGANGFLATSGSLVITKREYITTIGNDKDYYLDGNFSATMVNTENPPESISISGTFSGIHVPD